MTHYRYYCRHNGAVLYFLSSDKDEYLVTLNANGTVGCQHNGSQECSAGCMHVERAKLLEMQEQEEARKYYEAKQQPVVRTAETATLNYSNKGFSLYR